MPMATSEGPADATQEAGTSGAAMAGPEGGMGMGMGMMDPSAQVDRMGEMMRQMGAPKPRDTYPALMAAGTLDHAARHELEQLLEQHAAEGERLLSSALSELDSMGDGGDLRARDRSLERAHDGLSRLQTALSAKRLLTEGEQPRQIAMNWFRTELGLLDARDGGGALFWGMGVFHSSIMAILVLFAALSFYLYAQRSRRASALLRLLAEGDGGVASERFEGVLTHPRERPEGQNPTTPMSRREVWVGELELIGRFRETEDVATFRFAMPDGSPLPFAYEPGQYATVIVDDAPGHPGFKRAYTIASSPTQRDYVELTVKREPQGLASRHLHDGVAVGDKLVLEAPRGRFYFNGTQAQRVALIAGGVGITPMMSAIRYLSDHCWGGSVALVYSARTPAEFIFLAEIETIAARYPNLDVHLTSTRAEDEGWQGHRERIDAATLSTWVPDIAERRIHVCGPDAMMTGVRVALDALGIAAEQIRTEAFGPAAGQAPVAPDPSEGGVHSVHFERSGATATQGGNQTLLDAADSAGVHIDRSCLAGTCGACIVRLTAGEVSMAVDEALEPEERAAGFVLACQARAASDLAVDA